MLGHRSRTLPNHIARLWWGGVLLMETPHHSHCHLPHANTCTHCNWHRLKKKATKYGKGREGERISYCAIREAQASQISFSWSSVVEWKWLSAVLMGEWVEVERQGGCMPWLAQSTHHSSLLEITQNTFISLLQPTIPFKNYHWDQCNIIK